jgi:hypothetical protein
MGSKYPVQSLLLKETKVEEFVGTDATPYTGFTMKPNTFFSSGTPWVTTSTTTGVATSATSLVANSYFLSTYATNSLRVVGAGVKLHFHGARDGTTGKALCINNNISATTTYDGLMTKCVPNDGDPIMAGDIRYKSSLPIDDSFADFITPSTNGYYSGKMSCISGAMIMYTGLKCTATFYRILEVLAENEELGSEAPTIPAEGNSILATTLQSLERARDKVGSTGTLMNYVTSTVAIGAGLTSMAMSKRNPYGAATLGGFAERLWSMRA